MTIRVVAYNTLGTKDSRIVAAYDSDESNVRDALTQANYRACIWNKDETREDMRVNFVMAGGMVRTV